MVTLVVCENENKNIGARPLMFYCYHYNKQIFAQLHKKEILTNGYNYPGNLLGLCFFTRRRTG